MSRPHSICTSSICTLLATLALLAAPPSLTASSSPGQLRITPANLLDHEAWWPYQVAVTRPFPSDGSARTVPLRRLGALIRVEPEGRLRVDFGRYGRHVVPIASTDAVVRANRIARGETSKLAPNFVLSVRNILVSTEGPALMPVRGTQVSRYERFLCVYADPFDARFAALLASLAAREAGDETLTLVVPRSERADREVLGRMRTLASTVPFVTRRFRSPLTRAQLGADSGAPRLVLVSSEGRVLVDEPWSPRARDALVTAPPAVSAR